MIFGLSSLEVIGNIFLGDELDRRFRRHSAGIRVKRKRLSLWQAYEVALRRLQKSVRIDMPDRDGTNRLTKVTVVPTEGCSGYRGTIEPFINGITA